MADITMTTTMSPELLKVMERAKQDPQARLRGLARFIDAAALTRAFHALRGNAAVGVDGITKEAYEQALESNIQALHERLRTGRYRHQPIRRVHIPKERGKTRPLGISSTEDKIVQQALREKLEAVYEQDFLSCSYGYRPGRSAHDALRELDRVALRSEVNWVLEADLASYFDSLERPKLMEMLRLRIDDESLMRLIGKCLHAGVLDGEEYTEPESGVVQGSILSPLLGNVYLHHALDLWFERDVLPRLKGKARLIRYCDDFVIGLEREDDAKRVMGVLGQRLRRYGLTLHNRRGGWVLGYKTRKARLRRAIVAITEWCRRHRHDPVKEQHAALTRRIQGHYNYFGVNGNFRCLQQVRYAAERAWYKWLCRRSQRTRLNWDRFNNLLKVLPLPRPRIHVQLWAAAP
jgi:group II intron reverse transcriptase/maturase